jgi:hypothetical protein
MKTGSLSAHASPAGLVGPRFADTIRPIKKPGGGLMKALLVMIATVVAVATAMIPAAAQTPTLNIFFDQGFTRMDKDCPPGGGQDSLFVVGLGFNRFIAGVEYAIDYPVSIEWLNDYATPPVTFGETPTGITSGWPTPFNGYNPIVFTKVRFMWNCNGCTSDNQPVTVVAHPYTGYLGGVDFPYNDLVPAIGMKSLVCATVPVEETTWGQIKSLYHE